MKFNNRNALLALFAVSGYGLVNAQSTINIFGVADVSISHYSVAGGQKLNALADSNLNSSRLGFSGREDLGGGLAVAFWLEGATSLSDGNPGGFNFMRRSTISLIGPLGEVRMGRDFTPTFWIDALYDPFGAAGIGTNLIQQVRSTGTIPGRAAFVRGWGGNNTSFIRSSNSISYYLPKERLGGFHGQVQYAMQEQDVQAFGPSLQVRFLAARAGYAKGPLDISMAVARTSPAQATTTRLPGVHTASVGASYKFAVATLSGAYLNERYSDGNTNSTNRVKGFLAGAMVPIGAWNLNASYAHITSDLTGSPSVNKFALGYVYNMSKRTAFYGTFARIGNRNGAMITVNPAVTGLPGSTSSGVEMGIRHAF